MRGARVGGAQHPDAEKFQFRGDLLRLWAETTSGLGRLLSPQCAHWGTTNYGAIATGNRYILYYFSIKCLKPFRMFSFRKISKRTKDLSVQKLGASGGHFLVPSRKWIRIRPKGALRVCSRNQSRPPLESPRRAPPGDGRMFWIAIFAYESR